MKTTTQDKVFKSRTERGKKIFNSIKLNELKTHKYGKRERDRERETEKERQRNRDTRNATDIE